LVCIGETKKEEMIISKTCSDCGNSFNFKESSMSNDYREGLYDRNGYEIFLCKKCRPIIYFDIDGVLRALDKELWGSERKSWDGNFVGGVDVCTFLDAHPEVLFSAPPTEYLKSVKNFYTFYGFTLYLMSYQTENWRSNTEKWLKKHLNGIKYKVTYVTNLEDKLKLLRNNDLLIEDYPNFSDYSKIIIVDRKYNRHVKGVRVKTAKQLLNLLFKEE